MTTVNGGVNSLIRTLAIELAPVRFNAIHPGIVGDSPFWENKPLDAVIQRTPTGRLVTMAEVVGATVFLLENGESTASTSPSTVAGCCCDAVLPTAA